MNLHEEISKVAYELYLRRGCVHGHDLDDWLEAERIVLARHSGQEIEEPDAELAVEEETALAPTIEEAEETVIEETETPVLEKKRIRRKTSKKVEEKTKKTKKTTRKKKE